MRDQQLNIKNGGERNKYFLRFFGKEMQQYVNHLTYQSEYGIVKKDSARLSQNPMPQKEVFSMKKHLKRRFGAIAGAALMLCAVPGVLPGSTGFSFRVSAADTIVSTVGVKNVKEPVDGAHPVFDGIQPENEAAYVVYSQNINITNPVRWRDVERDTLMTETDTFKAGKQYELTVILNCKSSDGYLFPDDKEKMVGTVNGKKGKMSFYGPYPVMAAQLSYVFTAGEKQAISVVPVNNIPTPAATEKAPTELTLPDDSVYQWNGSNAIRWYDVTDQIYLQPGDRFQSEHSYRFEASVKPSDGYYFSAKKATVNGNTAEVTQYTQTSMKLTYDFGKVKTRIQTISLINEVKPIVGQYPNTADLASRNPNLYTVSSAYWLNEYDQKMENNQTFEAGKTYTLWVNVQATDDGIFAGKERLGGTLFGKTGTIARRSADAVAIRFQATPSQGTPISNVSVTGIPEPEVGKTPDLTNVKCGKNTYSLADSYAVSWYDMTNGTFIGNQEPFQSGIEYKVTVTLSCSNPYIFPSSVQIDGTINGKEAVVNVNDDHSVSLEYTFAKTAGTDTVRRVVVMDVPEPMDGMKPAYSGFRITDSSKVEIPDYNLNGFIHGVRWYDQNVNNDDLTENDTFITGHRYTFDVLLKPKSGYQFPADKTSVYAFVNGSISDNTARTDNISTIDSAYLLVSYDFDATAQTYSELSRIGVTGVARPVIGMHPVFNAVSLLDYGYHIARQETDTMYTEGEMWYNEDTNEPISPEDTFEENVRYSYNVLLEADPGYQFPEFVSRMEKTVNGFLAEAEYTNDNKYCLLYYTFIPRDNPILNDINIDTEVQPYHGDDPTYSPSDFSISPIQCEIADLTTDTGIKNGIRWMDYTAFHTLTEDDRIIAGHEYTIELYLRPKAGYTFLNQKQFTNVLWNGESVQCSGYQDDPDILVVYQSFVAKELKTIQKIGVCGVSQPFGYEPPTFAGISLISDGYDISDLSNGAYKNGMLWFDEEEEEAVSESQVFDPDEHYSINILLRPKDGWQLPDDLSDVKATVNGIPAELSYYNDFILRLSYTFEAVQRCEIDTVSLLGNLPKAGEHPFDGGIQVADAICHVSDYQDAVYRHGIGWYDIEAGGYMKPDDQFAAGKQYELIVLVEPNENYAFLENKANVDAYLNQKAAESDQFDGHPSLLKVSYTFTAESSEFIRGDVDGDGTVTSNDAQMALNAFLEQALGNEPDLTERAYLAADVDQDNEITAMDAQYILTYFLNNYVLGEPTDWSEVIL